MLKAKLPIIDVGGAAPRKATRVRVAADLDQAFRETGFCYVTNTGVRAGDVQAVFAESRRFHALATVAKQSLAVNAFHRGYIASGSSVIKSSSVATITRPNLSESLMVMHEVDPGAPEYGEPLQGPNQWPKQLPGFKVAVHGYMHTMTAFARRLTRLIALALSLPEHHLDGYFDAPTTWLRLLHYPPQPCADPQDSFGAAPHTDYGFLTILAQDALGGLRVKLRDGGWIDAPPLPDTFIVNVADMLARWTNDRWVSTPHMVRNTNNEARYSVPFFWDMSMHATVECLPGCVSAGSPPRYEPVRFGDYVMARLDKNYKYRHKDDP